MSEKRPELLVETGKLAGRRFVVGEQGLRLGRSSSNDIKVPDEELSRNHCLFEPSGAVGIRVIDLASANGTFVNGRQVASDPVELKPGDILTMGSTRLRVVGEGAPARAAAAAEAPATVDVDLGLGDRKPADDAVAQKGRLPTAAPAAGRRRSPLSYFLWIFAVAVLGLAGWLLFQEERPAAKQPSGEAEGVRTIEDDGRIVEMSYEKVSADSQGIFRYQMDLTPDGTLKVSVDDVPKADRHIVKSARLGEAAVAHIREIFSEQDFLALDREYAGPTEEPPKLESCNVKVVFAQRVKSVRVINTPEPDAFRRMREKLEAFSKNELGIWAIQYSTDKLLELAEASARTAQTKWDDREVEYGNVYAAIVAWREAMFYLETVNPKPPTFETYRAAKEMATAELERRYADQRFRADRAINLGDWTTAVAELKVLCEMIPDRADARAREASEKLLDAEKRQKGGAK